MGYYDGNTVTALWNYAQHFAMSDNSYSTTFGPSTPGALNLVSGQTHGVRPPTSTAVDGQSGTVDRRPAADRRRLRHAATTPTSTSTRANKNIGDLLNAQERHAGAGSRAASADCARDPARQRRRASSARTTSRTTSRSSTTPVDGQPAPPAAGLGGRDRARPTRPTTSTTSPTSGRRSTAGNLPAVSFLKAPAYQDGHAGYSDPLDEQHFLVDTINRLAEVAGLERAPRSSSPTTTPTAGTTTRWARSSTSRRTRRTTRSRGTDAAARTPTRHRAATRTAAATARGCRCWSISPYAQAQLRRPHASPTRPRSCASSRTTGGTGRIGDASFDEKAGSLESMFAFGDRHDGGRGASGTLLLDPSTGQPARGSSHG